MDEHPICEMCLAEQDREYLYCLCVDRQEAIFYARESGSQEIVWTSPDCEYEVLRCGRTSLRYIDDTGKERLLQYVDDFEYVGVKTDADLKRMDELPEERWLWILNPWFEVCSKNGAYFSDPFHALDEAVSYALELDSKGEEL